ncbi:hypothetical protein [Methylobacterium brachiatum]|jgi:hypothetical protein|uniref:hypothetical protein n=1 Tax=Methylobacterium brachiatum TaxID=269660 RepID=UPI000EFB18D3|nr:hypothetical protein [Methylobacterium brachiatum]AYO83129.1 hypothetical protein EBB05_13230 [Methylobacterium brachiatum]
MTSADDYDPGEAPSVRVLYDGTPVAQHGHTCDGCPMDRHIPQGTRYGKKVSIVDGEFLVLRHCLGGSCWDEHMAAARRPEPVTYGPNELPF